LHDIEDHKFAFVSLCLAEITPSLLHLHLFYFQSKPEKLSESESGEEVYGPSSKEDLAEGEELQEGMSKIYHNTG